MNTPATPAFHSDDPRWPAFRSPQGPEVFHSVVSTHDLWKPDPFDVEEIHAEARESFARTVDRINNADDDGRVKGGHLGKILLLRGESGAGKTHLLRAFRQHLHSRGLGWFAYLQMTTGIGQYPLYILRNLVESFSQPYDLSSGDTGTGWLRLSNFLAEHPSVPAELRAELREGESDQCARVVFEMTDYLLDTPHFARAELDPNVVRAVLFFQRREPAFARRAISFLRCEDMTGYDREYLGGIPPRTADGDPLDMLVQIGRLTHCFERQALVLCMDQLEEIWSYNADAAQRFRDAMGAMRALSDKHPAALVVVACLDAYYEKLKELIQTGDQSLLDRIEREQPIPVHLQSERSRTEVEAMIGRRLDALYQSQGVAYEVENRTFPFVSEDIEKLVNLRPRGVLLACSDARERSVRTGEAPRIGEKASEPDGTRPGRYPVHAVNIEGRWNDFRNSLKSAPPEAEPELAALLAWAVNEVNAELGLPVGSDRFQARAEHTFVEIDAPEIPETPRRWLAALCNAAATRGKLSGQVAGLTAAAAGARPARVPLALRATEFPGKTPKAQIFQQVAAMIKGGGRRVVIEDAEWRAMHALREFLSKQVDTVAVGAWRATDKPLSRLPGLCELLRVEKLSPPKQPPTGKPEDQRDGTSGQPGNEPKGQRQDDTLSPGQEVKPPVPEPGRITLGRTREAVPKPVTLDPGELTRHAAFLGGSGSGKTTAALAMIEGLLLRGIPVILLDRKGDLACYARPESWTAPLPEGCPPDAAARREGLRARLDVRLYTPGAVDAGRPLGISLLPPGAGALPGPEREAASRAAAASLGAMMGYRTASSAPKQAVLSRAIDTLAGLEPDAEMTLARLTTFIHGEDDSLVTAIGHLDTKLFKKLLQDLATFQVAKGHLLAAEGERVKAERLLGLTGGGDPAPAGKTRLSIISTKFFDDTDSALFWTAQFLLEMGRFAAKQPSTALQAAVLFDEADLYLPAVGKPVTKEPMENALKRWRSAGLSVLLASQSPGDFDYKCRDNVRTWFVGRVKEDTALKKMRPMLREAKTDIAAKLAGLEAGQFFVVRDGQVESLASARSLVAAEQINDAEILRLASGEP